MDARVTELFAGGKALVVNEIHAPFGTLLVEVNPSENGAWLTIKHKGGYDILSALIEYYPARDAVSPDGVDEYDHANPVSVCRLMAMSGSGNESIAIEYDPRIDFDFDGKLEENGDLTAPKICYIEGDWEGVRP